MYVCTYISMYACMYVCMYVCTSVSMYVCMYVSPSFDMPTVECETQKTPHTVEKGEERARSPHGSGRSRPPAAPSRTSSMFSHARCPKNGRKHPFMGGPPDVLAGCVASGAALRARPSLSSRRLQINPCNGKLASHGDHGLRIDGP